MPPDIPTPPCFTDKHLQDSQVLWIFGGLFFNIGEIFQLAGCKLVLKSIIKRNNPESSCASEIFGNVLLVQHTCLGNRGAGGVSSIPEQLQI